MLDASDYLLFPKLYHHTYSSQAYINVIVLRVHLSFNCDPNGKVYLKVTIIKGDKL